MSLVTAHKLLIIAAVAVLAYHGFWELSAYGESGHPGAALRGFLSLVGASAFAVYLRSFWMRTRGGNWRPDA